MHQRIVILDFGSQYTQLIARRVREAGVYSEIVPCTVDIDELREMDPAGIILSGGPSSVYDEGAPGLDPAVLNLKRADGSDMPVLGICYGLMIMCQTDGGTVERADQREFGRAKLIIDDDADLLAGVPEESIVWMSHGDKVTALPPSYEIIAHSDNAPIAAVRSRSLPHYGVQFHPEVVHTDDGRLILENFTHRGCGCAGDWSSASFIDDKIAEIRDRVGDDHVLLGLSGGVDSSVAAVLLHRAIGDQLSCVFVDNGLLRKGEWEQVQSTFRDHFHIRLKAVDASELFLSRLADVTDPEQKRKIIGATFVEVFDHATDELVTEVGVRPKYLAQGTLYPDVIESVSFKGPSATIKSHHNVGGLPEEMNFEILEPFRELFKDEVREIGRLLEVPPAIVNRHPFPGPGLGIRIIGTVDRDELDILREADAIFIEELIDKNLYHDVWQALAVLLPIRTVGVMGDERTYENVCALRAVTSVDGMTADWAHLPHSFLAHVSSRIVNEVRGINRVVYDISSKPPATIEWE
jgi:GMP synthase (glutamine-hydrolysing)